MSTMRGAKFYNPGDIRIEDFPIPTPGPNECLVEVEWNGICGSDLHIYLEGITLRQNEDDDGSHTTCILGHEFCGRIKSAPEGSNLKVGQAVMVDPRVTCGECTSCKSGKDHMCHKLIFLGGPGSMGGGGLSEYAVVEPKQIHVLPESVDLDFAALIEPLTVGHHAVKSAGINLEGLDVLVLGGGPIGLTLVPTLRAHRVRSILLSEPTEKRAKTAAAVVDRLINPRTDNVGDVCKALTNGKGVDVVFDCAGVAPALAGGIDALVRGGSYVNVAVWDKQITIPFLPFFLKEIRLFTAHAYNDEDWKEVVELIGKGAFDGYEKLVTRRVSLEDVVTKGFDELVNNKDDQIKILVSPKLKQLAV